MSGYTAIMEFEPSKCAKATKRNGQPGYYRCVSEGYGEKHVLSSWQASTDRKAKRLAEQQRYEFRTVEPR